MRVYAPAARERGHGKDADRADGRDRGLLSPGREYTSPQDEKDFKDNKDSEDQKIWESLLSLKSFSSFPPPYDDRALSARAP